jgi:hypothetical protein
MKLLIEKSQYYTEDFVKWVIGVLKDEILQRLSDRYLDNLQYYLNTMITNSTLSNDKIDVYSAMIQTLNGLEYVDGFSHYHIQINPMSKLFGTKFKLSAIAKLINYGNQDIVGCMVFTDSFYYVEDNIEEFYSRYLTNTGVR